MRGLLYCGFTLNKKWFLFSGIVAALDAAMGIVLLIVLGKDASFAVTDSVSMLLELFVMILCPEWIARDLESNLKNRFANYTLSCPVSRGAFVLTELVQTVICAAAGFAMSVGAHGIMSAFNSELWSADRVKMFGFFALFMVVFTFALLPLTIKFKSAEKAGIIVGLILGFGLIFPATLWNRMVEADQSAFNMLRDLISVFSEPWFAPAYIGVCAALLAVFFAIIYHKVKKGDVC